MDCFDCPAKDHINGGREDGRRQEDEEILDDKCSQGTRVVVAHDTYSETADFD